MAELKSELDSRQFIYYPLMDFEDSEIMQINLRKIEKDDRDISKISNSYQFDNFE